MRARFSIDALLGDAQPLHRPPGNEVFGDDLFGVFRAHVAVPHTFRIDNHRGAVLALIETAGFVDAHAAAQPGFSGQLLQAGVKIAFSIAGAGWAGRFRRAHIVTDKNVAFKAWQTEPSL
jgi:hypothetical protein